MIAFGKGRSDPRDKRRDAKQIWPLYGDRPEILVTTENAKCIGGTVIMQPRDAVSREWRRAAHLIYGKAH